MGGTSCNHKTDGLFSMDSDWVKFNLGEFHYLKKSISHQNIFLLLLCYGIHSCHFGRLSAKGVTPVFNLGILPQL